MVGVELAVVIPTLGARWTLDEAVPSASPAFVVIVRDGDTIMPTPLRGALVRIPGPHADYGCAARMAGVRKAAELGATHVAYLDDDDAYLPGAVDKMIAWCEDAPAALHIGRMVRAEDGALWWKDRAIRYGNVGTPMIVAPIDAAVATPWAAQGGYDADWRHAAGVAALTGQVVWHEDVIAVVRPWGRV